MQRNSSTVKVNTWLSAITSARFGPVTLCILLLISYVILPLGIFFTSTPDPTYTKLSFITLVAIFAILLGALTPVFDPWFTGRMPRVSISIFTFNLFLWCFFIIFVVVTLTTSTKIPLIAALSGSDAESVALLREQFLKAREGWQSSFVYINALLTGALIPYSLALMFLHGLRGRWIATCFFIFFCISFMEKAFFFRAAIPLVYLIIQGKAHTNISPKTILFSMSLLLILITFFSGSGGWNEISHDHFFSVFYLPQDIFQHLVWRSIAIPLITAVDAIRVFQEQFSSQYLGGTTSSFVAAILDKERIDFERIVFASQWGQNETGTGSANSVYITEAYINFGLPGVFFFSFIVGQVMRFFSISRDEAFRSLWLLFAFGIYTSGLLGVLLSNGFIILFFVVIFLKLKASN